MIGSSIAHFQITAKLGKGGMGEVYRATDERLNRDVAIKLLPESFSSDPERLTRFQREAQLLASLNHPNIGQVYGLEENDGCYAIVLELIDGEDLTDRIARGALPVEQTLQIALQIAEALEAAQEKGIVHRDLKPANVRLTPEGVVKVLDFGLAKALDPAETQHDSQQSPQNSPTMTMAATQAGIILGTASYMSPEQAAGQAADRRADIWSFGVVLWEMLTGAPLFDGETVSHMLAAVLREEPDYSHLPVETPPQLVQLIRRTLRKKPRERLQAIGDARIAIEDLLAGEQLDASVDGAAPPATPAVGRSPWWLVAAAAVVGGVVTLGAVALTGGWSQPQPQPAIRAHLELPPTLELVTIDRSIALSPDGSQVALAARDTVSGVQQIYLRPLDRLETRPLAGTEGASYPFWSPDGKAIGFFADVKLKRLDLAGGIVRTLCDAPAGRGADWNPHGSIVFSPSATGGLFEVPDEGGDPKPYTPTAEGADHRLPHFLPDGRGVLYSGLGFVTPDSSSSKAEESSWALVDEGIAVFAFHPETGAVRKVLDSGTEAFYVEPGYLVYVQDSNLMLQPFDPDALEPTGEPQPIAANVQYDNNRLFLQLDLVAGGTLVYQEVPESSGKHMTWLDRRGEETPIPTEPINLLHARLSPDGRRAAVEIRDAHRTKSMELIDLDRGIRTRLNPPGSWAAYPAWSHDGNRLAFQALVGAQFQLAVIEARPGETPVLVTEDWGTEQYPEGFTRDGQILFSRRSNIDKRGDLLIVDASEGSSPTPFLADSTNDSDARLSPNGRWVLFATFPAGADPRKGLEATEGATLSISEYPTTGRWQITRPDAAVRTWGWLSDREIYWQDTEGRCWVVNITPRDGAGPAVGTPQLLFDERVFADAGSYIVDYSLVREQFLVVRSAGPVPRARLVVVSDWRAAPDL